MSKSISFLHSADFHLGSPLKTVGAMSRQLQQTLREAAFTAVERLVDRALDYDVNFVLISGDIYDRDSRSVKANEFLSQQLQRLNDKNIPVCIIYGNHDPLGAAPDLYKMPPNVIVFPYEHAEMVTLPDERGIPLARVYGQSYGNPSDTRKMYADFVFPDSDTFNIGMLHTSLSPAGRAYVPCSLADLRSVPHIHYWALGHIHRAGLCSSETPVAAFPGIPQGRDPGEPGVGGCLLVEAGSDRIPTVGFIPLSEVVWLNLSIAISDEYPEDLDSLEEIMLNRGQEVLSQGPETFLPEIKKVPEAPCSARGYVVRWEITGRGRLHEAIAAQEREELQSSLENRLRQSLGTGTPFLWTESVSFRTAFPLPELSALTEKDTVFRTLVEERIKAETEPGLRKEIIKALGNVWYEQRDPEDIREDSIPLTDAKLKELLDRAQDLVFDRIIQEREHLDY